MRRIRDARARRHETSHAHPMQAKFLQCKMLASLFSFGSSWMRYENYRNKALCRGLGKLDAF